MSKAVDTNVLVYLYDASAPSKRVISEQILSETPVISGQVVSEYLNVTRRLLKLPKADILERCNKVFAKCTLSAVSQVTLEDALTLLNRYDFQLFDALIVASALQAGCTVLYSEDLQHNQWVEGKLRIVNPFL